MPVSDAEYEKIKLYSEEARYQCDCSCHTSTHVRCFVACCSPCRHCGLRIRSGGMKRHVKRLHPEKEGNEG